MTFDFLSKITGFRKQEKDQYAFSVVKKKTFKIFT